LSESDFYPPTDVDTLRMENELLAFEVRFLRARLGGARSGLGSVASQGRLSHLEEAEGDLVLLLRRMGRGPLGALFRRSANFRTLEQRYLHPPSEGAPASTDRVAYLEGAEKDLVLLLRRMGRGPLGALFRRRKSFRALEQRYL
jgi:hypothetical protein